MATYAGVGARITPPDVLELMTDLAQELARAGYTLRTGGAQGADQAFERGALEADGNVELFLPWTTFYLPFDPNGRVRTMGYPLPEAFEITRRYFPGNWNNQRHGTRKLHARNAHIVLGESLADPVDFLVCWTPFGRGEGGTGQAIRIARGHGVPIIDLGRHCRVGRLRDLLDELPLRSAAPALP